MPLTKLVEGLNDAATGMMGFCGNLCRQEHDGLEMCDPKGVMDSDPS